MMPPEIEMEAEVRYRQRQLMAVGHHAPGESARVARLCGWCGRWHSDEDMAAAADGAPLSHGMCPACDAHHFPDEKTARGAGNPHGPVAPEGAEPEVCPAPEGNPEAA